MKWRILPLLLALLLSCANLCAQDYPNQLFFKRYNIDDGLSEATVNCVIYDSQGFMWVGTNNGLNKFDGYDFQIFKSIDNDSNSVTNDIINDIVEDDQQNLWIATAAGLTKYNLRNHQFKQFHTKKGVADVFRNLNYDPVNNRIWIALLQGGLYYLDLNTEILHAVNTPVKEVLVYDVQMLNTNHLVVTTIDAGFYLYNIKTEEVTQYSETAAEGYRIPENIVRGLDILGDTLLIGFQSKGLMALDLKTNSASFFNKQNSNLNSNQIYALTHDDKGNVWLGTDGGGVNIINLKSKKVSSHRKIEGDPYSLSANVVRHIQYTGKGNVLLGTYKGGLNVLNEQSYNFITIKQNFNNPVSLSGASTKCFIEDPDGIWIGSDGGGLDFLSNSGELKNMTSINSQITSKKVLCMEKDSLGYLWIGTYNKGLFRYKNGTLKSFIESSKYQSLKGVTIWDLEIDHNQTLWVATNLGLYRYNYAQDTFTRADISEAHENFYLRNELRVIKNGKKDILWIGSSGGLIQLNTKTGERKIYENAPGDNQISNNLIISLWVNDTYVFAGSFGGGLNILDLDQNKVQVLNAKNQDVPSNIIFSIVEDFNRNLWVSTNEGLTVYDQSLSIIKTFNQYDGLQGNIFNKNASYRTADGKLLFGGINGFNLIDPNKVSFAPLKANVSISDFRIFNEPILIGPDKMLKQDINMSRRIDIPYRKARFFTIEFSGLDYIYQQKLQYAYKLEGFDDAWHYIGKERKVSFTNLSPDNYRLLIKSSFDGIDWRTSPTALAINIVPPFWMTWYFKFGAVLLSIFLAGFMYSMRVYNLKKKQSLLKHEVASKTSEIQKQNDQLNKMHFELQLANTSLEEKVKNRTRKLNDTIDELNKTLVELDRFVYSASHDLSAPLKSIMGLVNIARLDTKNINKMEYLAFIEASITKLEKVILSLVQYSMNSKKEIHLEKVNLQLLIEQNCEMIRQTNELEHHHFEIKMDGDNFIQTDRNRMNVILHNLINNSIKFKDYSKPGSFTHITLSPQSDYFTITIEDNGIGFPKKYEKRIFEMFFRANEQSSGSGLGLYIVKEAVTKLGGTISVDSEIGKGTKFELKFMQMMHQQVS